MCGTKVDAEALKCPSCKYEIGKKVEEAKAAAKARGEVEPPEPVAEHVPTDDMPKPPIPAKVFFILIGIVFLGLVILGLVRQAMR